LSRANDPASAIHIPGGSGRTHNGGWSQMPATHTGLTIREHFAAMAMQGLVASRTRYADHWRIEWDSIATCAVKQADALIAELAKVKP
jgi:hypothetical protein